MICLLENAKNRMSKQGRNFLRDQGGQAATQFVFSLSCLSFAVVLGVMMFESKYNHGYSSFGFNLVKSLTFF